MLYIHKNTILEATTSNIFLVKNSILYTPADNVLKGITRKLTLDIAKKLNIKVNEQEISITELYDADEAFITATNKKILPIIQIDSKVIGDGKVGEITKKLLNEYQTLIS